MTGPPKYCNVALAATSGVIPCPLPGKSTTGTPAVSEASSDEPVSDDDAQPEKTRARLKQTKEVLMCSSRRWGRPPRVPLAFALVAKKSVAGSETPVAQRRLLPPVVTSGGGIGVVAV